MENSLYYRLKQYKRRKTGESYKNFLLSLLSEENAEVNLFVPITFAENGKTLYSLRQYDDSKYLYIACIPGEKLPDDEIFTTVKTHEFLNMLMDDREIFGAYFNPYNDDGAIVPSDILRNFCGR